MEADVVLDRSWAAADRARTVLATSSDTAVAVLQHRLPVPRHVVGIDGAVYFPAERVPYRCRRRLEDGGTAPVELVASDVSSVPQPDRVRGVVRVLGGADLIETPLRAPVVEHLRLETDPRLVRVVPASIMLEWRVERGAGTCQAEPIALSEWVIGRTEPLAGWEGEWTEHLDRHHPHLVHRLAVQYGAGPDHDVVHPVLADAAGVVLRCYPSRSAAVATDIRVPFPWRATCGCQAVAAFGALVSRAG
jgi:hypothetical protein